MSDQRTDGDVFEDDPDGSDSDEYNTDDSLADFVNINDIVVTGVDGTLTNAGTMSNVIILDSGV